MSALDERADGRADARADERDEASRRLLDVAERELRRILLDIHDGPVQYMYAALAQLELLRGSLAPATDAHVEASAGASADDARAAPTAVDRVERARTLLEAGLHELRSVIGALRPPAFESRDLRELIEGLVLQHESATDTRVTLACDAGLPDVAVPAKVACYRVVQEALSNAYRHGGARHVAVRVGSARHDGAPWITLDVRDDGAGFDAAAVPGAGHFGLAGMRDRARMLGGSMALDSTPGHGALITFAVPAAP